MTALCHIKSRKEAHREAGEKCATRAWKRSKREKRQPDSGERHTILKMMYSVNAQLVLLSSHHVIVSILFTPTRRLTFGIIPDYQQTVPTHHLPRGGVHEHERRDASHLVLVPQLHLQTHQRGGEKKAMALSLPFLNIQLSIFRAALKPLGHPGRERRR